MLNFIDTKVFGASCVGLGALGTSYVAGLDNGYLVTLSLLAMAAYYLFFSQGKLPD
jgi:hypothetical protein